MFEFRVGTIVAAADTGIFGVHEYIRADLQLIINAARRLDCESSGPGAADDLTGKVFRGQRLQCLAHRIDGERDRLRAFMVGRHVLRAAMVGLQSAEFQVRCIRDAACERGRIPARRHALPTPSPRPPPRTTPNPPPPGAPRSPCSAPRNTGGRVPCFPAAPTRRNLRSPTTWLLTSTSFTPPRTSTSASPTFCTHW